MGKLKECGLSIDDEPRAITYLNQINYYRLSAYFIPYQSTKDIFDNGVTFDQIIKTYSFDRELRLLIFDYIERIEVAFRTQFNHRMAMYYEDSHWQDNPKLFIDDITYKSFQNIISKAMKKQHPLDFIKHYKDSYYCPTNPPSWMFFKLLTFGDLSRLYKALKENDDKKRIANFFELPYPVLQSWLHSLAYVRNICAHHARLWNKILVTKPVVALKIPKSHWVDSKYDNNERIFYFICILKYLLDFANDNNSFTSKLEGLFQKYPTVPIKHLGIPSDEDGNLLDWKSEPLFIN